MYEWYIGFDDGIGIDSLAGSVGGAEIRSLRLRESVTL